MNRTMFADFSPEEVLNMTYREQNYRETTLIELPKRGLSSDYVYRETKRALAGADGSIKIWPGIDIDIPTEANQSKCTPQGTRDAVKAAFRAARAAAYEWTHCRSAAGRVCEVRNRGRGQGDVDDHGRGAAAEIFSRHQACD